MKTRTYAPESTNDRISVLATPKPVPTGHIEDRRSVYWVDKEPALRPKNDENIPKRIQDLSKARAPPVGHIPDRPSPIWTVSEGAKNFPDSDPHMTSLSRPKSYHAGYLASRILPTRPKKPADSYEASKRTEALARAKKKLSYDEMEDYHLNEMKQHQTSQQVEIDVERLDQLAKPKSAVDTRTELIRSPLWRVPVSATNAEASPRLESLSKPKTRVELDHGYDPYKVSPAAKKAVASVRLNELCIAPAHKQVSPKK